VLAPVPPAYLTRPSQHALQAGLDDFQRGLLAHNDQARAHMTLGILYERMREVDRALEAYKNAIRVQPDVWGPRKNLAALHDQLAESAMMRQQRKLAQKNQEVAKRLRAEELKLLARYAKLAPDNAVIQYHYGLLLHLHGQKEEAARALAGACRMEPNSPDYLFALALLHKEHQRWREAIECAERLVQLRPEDARYRQLLAELRDRAE
jgi:Flp pilus assembly protein TadD